MTQGTVKEDRDACKHCGCTEWVDAKEITAADKKAIEESVVGEAKMMDNMDGKDEANDVRRSCLLPQASMRIR